MPLWRRSRRRGEPSSMRERQHFLADSLPPIGREEEKRTILDKLNADGFHVVTIHGIGGSGKTTLAQLVHDAVDNFDLKTRICVSDSFEFGRVIKKILDGLGEGVTGRKTVDQLGKLRNRLRGKSFLVVFDDLRSNDEAKWGELANFLMDSSKQVNIVVTTREQSVVNMIDTVSRGGNASRQPSNFYYPLNVLSVDDLLRLLERYAVREGQDEIPNDLRTIGREIVTKCEGLPLAVKILASCLSETRDATDWRNIHDESNFELLLKLTRDLPVYCKDRFFYFSPLLQHRELKYEDFFDLWITDGLFDALDQEMSVMVVEKELKSIIRQGHWDILRDLICHPTIIRRLTENQWPVINASNYDVGEHVVHLSISCEDLNRLNRLKGVETLFIWVATSKLFSKKLVSKFGPLRMLVLKRSIFELPNCMHRMTHLKCLNLSWNSRMEELPSFIFELKNLEILKLEGCKNLKEIPKDIKELKGLKVLSITAKKMDSPSAIAGLTSLQSLLLRGCDTPLPISKYLTSLTALQSLKIYSCPILDFKSEGANKSLLELELEQIKHLEALPLGTTSLRFLHIKRCRKLKELPVCLLEMPLERIVIDDCPKLVSLPEPMPRLQSLRNLKIRFSPQLESYVKDIRNDEVQRNYFAGKLDIPDDQ